MKYESLLLDAYSLTLRNMRDQSTWLFKPGLGNGCTQGVTPNICFYPAHPTMKPPALHPSLALLSLVALLPLTLDAGTLTWTGPTGGDWDTDSNWTGDTSKPVAGDTVLFNTPGNYSVLNSVADQQVLSITFNTTATSGNFTIGSTNGKSITLGHSGAIIMGNLGSNPPPSDRLQTVNSPLILGGTAYTFRSNIAGNNSTNNSIAAGSKLIIAGSVTGGNTAATTLVLDGNNGGANTLSGLISDGASSSLSIVKSSAGRWTLSNDDNSFSGGVSVNNGSLYVTTVGNTGSNSALGTNGTIRLGSGSNSVTFVYTGSGETSNKTIALTGTTGGISIYSAGTGALVLSGNVDILGNGDKTLTLRGNSATGYVNELQGSITDSANGATSLLKGDGNIWALSGSNSYSGGTTVNNGTLQVGNGGTSGTLGSGAVSLVNASQSVLRINRSDAFELANDIRGAGTLQHIGSGTTTLSGTNTYTGATTLTAGTLSVAVIGNGGSTSGNLSAATNAAANLVFNGGALQYTGATASTDRNFTVNAGKTAVFDIKANNLTLTGNSTATNGSLAKTGAGTLTLAGTNLYTGATTVTGGTLVVDGSIATSSGVTLAANTRLAGVGSVSSVTLAGNNTLSSSGTLTTNGLTINGSGNQLDSGTVAGSATIHNDATFSTLLGTTLQGAVTTSGAVFNNGTIDGVVTVAEGGLLGGSGVVTGATTIDTGGTLAPGNSPGLLTFDSDLTLNGTTLLEIAGTDRGTTYDAINVGGTLTYGGALSFVFSTTLVGGESFALFTGADGTSAPATTGQAVSVLLSGNGYDGTLSRTGDVWSGTNIGGLNFSFNETTGILSAASAIPEPSTYALLFGAIALGAVLLRRGKN